MKGKTETDQYPRQSLGTRDWKAVEAKLRALDGESKDQQVYGPKLTDCIQRYTDARKRDGVHWKTHNQIVLSLERLKTFASSRNVYHSYDLNVDLIEDFKTYGMTMIPKATTRVTAFAKVHTFLREAYRRGWVKEALAEKVKSPKARHVAKLPYTDAEVKTILEGVGDLKRDRSTAMPRINRHSGCCWNSCSKPVCVSPMQSGLIRAVLRSPT